MSFVKDQFVYKILTGSYVPVLGNDLFKIVTDKKISPRDELFDGNILTNIDDYLLKQLSEIYGINQSHENLLELLSAIDKPVDSNSLKSDVKYILDNLDPGIIFAEPLLQLVEIEKFTAFINGSVSNLLQKILTSHNTSYINQLNFSIPPNSLLNFNFNQYSRTLINILGTTNSLNYALSENELIDFLFLLNNQGGLAEILFDIINDKNLLLIGLTLPPWILKIFVKLLINLRNDQSKEIVIVSRDVYYNPEIENFLANYGVKIFPTSALGHNSLIPFVSELGDSVKKQSPKSKPKYMESLFISYSRKDTGFVSKLKSAFANYGISVWYDIESLCNGDDFDSVIQDAISKKCKYFLPIISKSSIENPYSYVYHHEWMTATVMRRLNEKGLMSSFIKPIIIDQTSPNDNKIPPEFRQLNMENVQNPDDFDTFIKRFIMNNELTLI